MPPRPDIYSKDVFLMEEPVRNSYLKKYVQMHPDNKMGWYLLGKEYEKEGQLGKANYCFNRSGGIYEAFETSKMPSDIWQEYELKLLQQAEEKERRTARLRRAFVALMILLLALVPSVDAPRQHQKAKEAAAVQHPDPGVEEDKNQASPHKDDRSVPPAEDAVMFTAVREGGLEKGVTPIAPGPLAHPGLLGSRLAVLEMKKQGKWLLWKRRLPVGYTLENKGGGAVAYQSYDPKTCSCRPEDGEKLAKAAFAWTGEQEELALLGSAIRAYKNHAGRYPEQLADLARPFPDNWISGTTESMKEAFQPLLAQAKAEAAGQEVPHAADGENAQKGEGPLADTWGGRPYFAQPLTIIVDKSSHRLAVVSGGVMLRNYKVGLGAERTPEGKFAITDKVMNPNGRADGEFGSRGMQLSDTNYAIHGTDEPDSIGKDESLGCIRMSKADVEELFDLVPMGTPVMIGKGGLPDEPLASQERFRTKREQDQTNPQKTYHWL